MSPRRFGQLGRAVLLVALLPLAASAHTSLVRSIPASRTVVATSPLRVELWFSERVEASYASMSVWNASGTRVDRQNVAVGPEDPKRLSVGLFTLRPGAYTVRYRVLSIDGHVLESSYAFTVGYSASR